MVFSKAKISCFYLKCIWSHRLPSEHSFCWRIPLWCKSFHLLIFWCCRVIAKFIRSCAMSENNLNRDPRTARYEILLCEIGPGAGLRFENFLVGRGATDRLWCMDPWTLSYGQVFSVERYSSTMNLSNLTFIVLQSETTFQQWCLLGS